MRLSERNQYKRTTLGGMGDLTDILNQATSAFTSLTDTALQYQQQRDAITQASAPSPIAAPVPAPVKTTTMPGLFSGLGGAALLIPAALVVLVAMKFMKR